jgi:hypothetical protein
MKVKWLKCASMKPEKTKAIDDTVAGSRSRPRTRAYQYVKAPART